MDSSAAFSGKENLKKIAEERNIPKKEFDSFFTRNTTYTLFKKTRNKFDRVKTIPWGYLTHMQFDLGVFLNIKNESQGYGYLLLGIDVMSRLIVCSPIKTKKPEDVQIGLLNIFKQLPIPILVAFTDQGREFTAKSMQTFFRKHHIQHYTSSNQKTKAALSERALRSVKERLYKVFSHYNTLDFTSVVQKVVDGINRTVNRTTGLRPIDFNLKNQRLLWKKLYQKDNIQRQKSKLKPDMYVRIPYKKDAFDKGFLIQNSDQIYRIKICHSTQPPTFSLEDEDGVLLKRKFYEPELTRVDKEKATYRVEKVLKTKMKKNVKWFYVKWVSFSNRHNSWISEDDFVN